MKTLFRTLLLLATLVLAASCDRDYNEPLLQEPVYEGEANITIAELKDYYSSVTTTAQLIELDWVVKGYLSANDVSGNVYKQLFIQDGTGGLLLSIDQNSMYTTHRVGQEIFVELHDLYIYRYGGEIQIGYSNGDRLPYEIFKEHEHFNGYPQADKVVPVTKTISQFTDEDVHTLVRIDNITFANGGVNAYTTNDVTTSEQASDGTGTIDIRTSAYADFAADMLPAGDGTVVGILGRFNNAWQITLRSIEDVFNFPDDQGGVNPDPETGGSKTFYKETFGTGNYPSGSRPKIAAFTDFDVKDVDYTDQYGTVDIRSSSTMSAHAWFSKDSAGELSISGLNTSGYEGIQLTFAFAINLEDGDTGPYNSSNLLKVSFNGTELTVPSRDFSTSNSFVTLTIDNIPAAENSTLRFYTTSAATGFRIDDITLTGTGDGNSGNTGGGGTVTPSPGPGEGELLSETFGTENVSSSALRKKIAEYTGYDATNVTYSDQSGLSDIRSTGTFDNHVWLPNTQGSGEVTVNVDSYFTVSGLDAAGQTCTLTFDVAANTYGIAETVDLADMIEVTWNGAKLTLPSTPVTSATNAYTTFTVSNLTGTAGTEITFHGVKDVSIGLRLDNIKVVGSN